MHTTGWWYTYPSEKYESPNCSLASISDTGTALATVVAPAVTLPRVAAAPSGSEWSASSGRSPNSLGVDRAGQTLIFNSSFSPTICASAYDAATESSFTESLVIKSAILSSMHLATLSSTVGTAGSAELCESPPPWLNVRPVTECYIYIYHQILIIAG